MATVIYSTGAAKTAQLDELDVAGSPRRRLDHTALVRLLQRAYSAEMAASFAYIGHAYSVRDPAEKAAIKQLEDDVWCHRPQVWAIMGRYDIPVSRWLG